MDHWIGLRENFNRKNPYLMVKTMVSCRFSLKPIQWKYGGNMVEICGSLASGPNVSLFKSNRCVEICGNMWK